MDRSLAALVGAALLLVLTGCAGPRPAEAPVTTGHAAPASTAVDVCAMVPAAALKAAMGVDPGPGVATRGKVDGGRCTWRASDARTAIAQFTRQPDVNFPEGVRERPVSASDVPGATRGFAAAETHTVLVVKGGHGLLFTDVSFQQADQSAYDALAKATVAEL